jgi:hypothetical protein
MNRPDRADLAEILTPDVRDAIADAVDAQNGVTRTDAELEENLRVDEILDGLQERNWTRDELDGHRLIARLLADGGK